MPDWLRNLVETFSALPPARQLTLVGTMVGSLVFFAWISNGTRAADYRVLYRGLEDAEIAAVVDGLAAERIEYQISEGGSAVEVPAARIHEARMRIASRGLPSGSSPGFEIFDRGTFGVTDFVQKVNYHRALQGELARTIEQVEGVAKARVQLAIPDRKVLLRKQDRKPTASVVTMLRAGWDLDSTQVRGIVHLVASSVEGLDPGEVTLVDNRGRLLAPQPDIDLGGRGPGQSLGAARRLEAELESQIESILERTVGLGRVVAKVNAQLDWTQTEKTEETFDPDSQVARSTQVDSESSQDGVAGDGGPAGIVANSPESPAVAATGAGGAAGSQRSSETTNYEISKVISRHVLPVGRIERLSIAVLVDGKPASAISEGEGAVDAENPSENSGFVAWNKNELEELEELAKRAVGFSDERGDLITVHNAPFTAIDAEEGPGGFLTPDVMVLLQSVLHGVAFLVGLLLFAKLFVRPLADAVGSGDTSAVNDLRAEMMQKLAAAGAAGVLDDDGSLGGEGGFGEDADIPGLTESSDEMSLQAQVDRLAQVRSDDSVRTIRGWMAS